MDKTIYLKKLSDGVLEMEDEDVIEQTAQEYVAKGHSALDGIMDGLVDGMNRASQLYEEEEYFVSDLLLCSDAMYAGLGVLKPHLPNVENEGKVGVVIGVVEGDTHDIGKNLVRIMLETAGFEMHDLGRDVPIEKFVEKVKETGAKLLCLSTLMTTTMPNMERVIKRLKEEGLRDDVIVMIGGGPLSSAYAKKIEADAYSPNAIEAVKTAKELLNLKAMA